MNYSEKYERLKKRVERIELLFSSSITVVVLLTIIAFIVVSLTVDGFYKMKVQCLLLYLAIISYIIFYIFDRQSKLWLNALKIIDVRDLEKEYIFILRPFKSPFRSDNVLKENVYVNNEHETFTKREWENIGDSIFTELNLDKLSHFIFYLDGAILKYPNTIRLVEKKEAWFSKFTAYANNCKAILIIPGDSDGIYQEMHYSLNKYLYKSIFVLPPTNKDSESLQSERLLTWNSLQLMFKNEYKFDLPNYNKKGNFLLFDKNEANLIPFDILELDRLISSFPSGHGTIKSTFIEQGDYSFDEMERINKKYALKVFLYEFITLLLSLIVFKLMLNIQNESFKIPAIIIYVLLAIAYFNLLNLSINWEGLKAAVVTSSIVFFLWQFGIAIETAMPLVLVVIIIFFLLKTSRFSY